MTAYKSVVLSSSLAYIQQYAFQNCTSLEHIELPASLQRLQSFAFAYSGLKKVTIPNNVQSIPMFCFAYAPLEEIHIGSNCEKIEKFAFFNDEAKKLGISLNVYIEGYKLANEGAVEDYSFDTDNRANQSLHISNSDASLYRVLPWTKWFSTIN